MKRKKIILSDFYVETTQPNWWIDYTKNASIYHQDIWAKLCRAKNNEPLYCYLKSNIGVELVLLAFKTNINKSVIIKKIISFLFGINEYYITIYSCPYSNSYEYNKLQEFMHNIIIYFKKEYIIFNGELINYITDKELNKDYYGSILNVEKWQTYIIDLKCSIDDIFKKLSKSLKKDIRRYEKKLLMKEMVCWNEYETHFLKPYLMLKDKAEKNKPHLIQNEQLWLKGYKENIYRYFILLDSSNSAVAFLGYYASEGIATEITSAIVAGKKIPAQSVLHWEVIKYAKNMGLKYFNLAGVSPNQGNIKESNIKLFKSKWNGKSITYEKYYKESLRMKWLKWLLSKYVYYVK